MVVPGARKRKKDSQGLYVVQCSLFDKLMQTPLLAGSLAIAAKVGRIMDTPTACMHGCLKLMAIFGQGQRSK